MWLPVVDLWREKKHQNEKTDSGERVASRQRNKSKMRNTQTAMPINRMIHTLVKNKRDKDEYRKWQTLRLIGRRCEHTYVHAGISFNNSSICCASLGQGRSWFFPIYNHLQLLVTFIFLLSLLPPPFHHSFK